MPKRLHENTYLLFFEYQEIPKTKYQVGFSVPFFSVFPYNLKIHILMLETCRKLHYVVELLND